MYGPQCDLAALLAGNPNPNSESKMLTTKRIKVVISEKVFGHMSLCIFGVICKQWF